MAILVFVAGMAIDIAHNASDYNINIFRTVHSGWFLLFSGFFAVEAVALVFLVVLWLPRDQKFTAALDKVAALAPAWRIVGFLGLAGLLPVFSLVIVQPTYVRLLDGSWVRASVFLFLSLAGMLLLKLGRKDIDWPVALGLAVEAHAIAYTLVNNFSLVTNYPFSLTWTETSRYYGASLFFSERLYSIEASIPVLHPAWHLLLTPPFWLGNLPIWVHRFWQALLQVTLPAALALAVVKRLRLEECAAIAWGVAGWVYLFLIQGPILIHLLVVNLTLIFGTVPSKFWRTTTIVLSASVWAGLCRINWFPMPGILATVLYLLEVRLEEPKRWLSYLWKPVFWTVVGTLTSLCSNISFMSLSGNGIGGNFTSSLASDLLWYRLLLNPTYPRGILQDLLLISAPVFLLISLTLHRERKAFHPVRLAGLFAILAVFLLGGLVVSVKIGGGRDLHNMDAYITLLMLIGVFLVARRATPDLPVQTNSSSSMPMLAMAILVPVWMAMQVNFNPVSWDRDLANQVLQSVREKVEEISRKGEPVLFISERHLITFGYVDVPLVVEYEKDSLMEMIMSHNRNYLDNFRADLSNQRFGMIVLDSQTIQHYGRSSPFGEEDDYWVDAVSTPLLCYYQPAIIFKAFHIALYVPSDRPCK